MDAGDDVRKLVEVSIDFASGLVQFRLTSRYG